MSSQKYGLFAAGDNSYHQIFDGQRVAPRFQFCKELKIPYYQILQIIAWNDRFAILQCNNSISYINSKSELTVIHPSVQLTRIQFHQNSILGLNPSGYLFKIDLETKFEEKISDYQFRTFSSSENFIIGITTDPKKESILFITNDPEPKLLRENTVAVGCTDKHVFASSGENMGLYVYDIENKYLVKMDFKKKVVSMSCSEDFALFITDVGCLYQFSSCNSTSAPTRLFGLPPIVEACPGQQHCAAISYDGRLFTWGFNPSCQLGIGSDRPSKDPICAIDSGVFMAACGSQNTWALKKPKKPICPEFLKLNVEANVPKKDQCENSNAPYRSAIIV